MGTATPAGARATIQGFITPQEPPPGAAQNALPGDQEPTTPAEGAQVPQEPAEAQERDQNALPGAEGVRDIALAASAAASSAVEEVSRKAARLPTPGGVFALVAILVFFI